MPESPSDREIIWRQYALHLDLYKFHMDATVKYNIFYFAITGGVVSYVFSTSEQQEGVVKWALLLPIFLSICFMSALIYATFLVQPRKAELENIKDQLKINTVPNMTLLQVITALLSLVHAIVIIGLIIAIANLQSWNIRSRLKPSRTPIQ